MNDYNLSTFLFRFRLTTHKMNHTIARGRNYLLNSFMQFGKFKRNQAEIYNRNILLQWTEDLNIKLVLKVGLMAEHETEISRQTSNLDLYQHYLCYFPSENYR